MLTLNLADFSLEHFMAYYWQQKPVVIRQGFAQFDDLISPNDLAGMAMEEAVESRRRESRHGVGGLRRIEAGRR